MKLFKILTFVFLLVLFVNLVNSETLEENKAKISCTEKFCYKAPKTIDFEGLEDGFKFNGISVKSKDNKKITILEEIDGKIKKVRFIPEIEKEAIANNVEYEFNKQPYKTTTLSYFEHIKDWLNYLGANNISEIEDICKNNTRCKHENYTYTINEWPEENLVLNTKKVDLVTGDYYNVISTSKGFMVTDLEGLTEIKANDVITSGGELYINEISSCEEFVDYALEYAPQCIYLNTTKDLDNHTNIDLKCKVHLNASEFNCNGYNLNFLADKMVDYEGLIYIHSNSRANLTNGEIKITYSDTSLTPKFILYYDNTLTNHSQYAKDFVFRGVEGGTTASYFNLTGDNVQYVWTSPSGAYSGGMLPSRINGVNVGIHIKGDSVNFPLLAEGLINGDMTESPLGYCFYIWQTNVNVTLTGGKWDCGDNIFFFGGALFSVKYIGNAEFKNLEIIARGGLDSNFFGTGLVNYYNVQAYTFNESGTDLPVEANVSVYTTNENPYFGDIYYNNVTSNWNTPIRYYSFYYYGNTVRRGYYTGRIIIENSSYHKVNSTLNIHLIENGKKDLILRNDTITPIINNTTENPYLTEENTNLIKLVFILILVVFIVFVFIIITDKVNQ